VGIGWGSLIWGLFNGLFWAGLWYLCGLIWLARESRNLRLLEGLELIFEYGMDGYGWENNRGEDGRNGVLKITKIKFWELLKTTNFV